jgi:F0F1-type ATP synthase assembly protein I
MKTPEDNKSKNERIDFVKYSSIGFQMLATIGLFAFIGYKIDEHQNNSKPIITAILSLIGVAISLYQVVKQLNKKG